MLDGALAGLSLLHDEPNFRHSMPTKVVEYMARDLPVVTTPLPAAAELARGHECRFVVPFGDPGAAADAVLELDRDFPLRAKMGRRGHEAAYSSLGWPSDAREFVAQLESWAKSARARRYETGHPVRWNAMKPGFHGVRRIHLPFTLPFLQRIYLPFSLRLHPDQRRARRAAQPAAERSDHGHAERAHPADEPG